MAKTKATPKKAKQTKSFILYLALILLIGYFIMTIIGLQAEAKGKRDIYNAKAEQLQQIDAENARKKNVLENDDKSAYIEQEAREKLGYVMQGEKVYYDVTPG